MTIWTRLRNLFGRSRQPINECGDVSPYAGEMVFTQDHLVELMQRLETTMENVYSCDEAFALLDEYVEMVANKEEAEQLMPLVKNHLDLCPDCRDEFEVLLHILETADLDTDD